MTLFNTLNVHNGVTVLFYLNDNRITLEAIIYGLASAIMLTSVIIWFSCFSVIVTADKFIYLFGRAAPVLALTLSMLCVIFLLQHRFGGTLGLNASGSLGKKYPFLIAWSLEASIESADSMEARGYGLRGRSSFHLFRFAGGEKVLLAAILLLGGAVVAACAAGSMSIYYYPAILLPRFTVFTVDQSGSVSGIDVHSMVLDMRGIHEWKLSHAAM